MKIIEARNYKELSKIASEIIIDEILEKPNLVMGFATGETPKKTYKNLIKAYKKKKVDFSKIKTFNLDEFYPIKENDLKSYRKYMLVKLFNKINVDEKNIHLLNGSTKNPEKECLEYEKKINKKPIDLQILGVGENGHIGFNEPGSSRNSKTRLVNLTHRKGKALTIGISTIMKAKKIILLASGKKKAKAIQALIEGKQGNKFPVSFLKEHKNLIVVVDRKAGSLI